MAVSTKARTDLASVRIAYHRLPVGAAKTIFAGTFVGVLTSTGGAQMMTDTANLVPFGIARQDVDNAGGSLADKYVEVTPIEKLECVEFNCASADVTWVGKLVSFSDDNTVALPATTTNDICAGRVVGFVSATKVIVDVRDRFASPAAA